MRRVAILLALGALFVPAPAWAAPGVTLSKTVGPPTTALTVTGSGFPASAAVDVYFDTTDEALVVADAGGAFSLPLTVPSTASPGRHWVTAVSRSGGTAAQVSFLVRTDWAMFRYSPAHSGSNPFENVLSPASAGGLGQAWAAPLGSAATGAVVAAGSAYAHAGDGTLEG